MQSIVKLISPLVLGLALSTAAAAKPATEEIRIQEAIELYSQATPMDQSQAERSPLLLRAETILLEVIDKNPRSLDAHRKLMGVYLQMRNYRKAIQTMQSAISLAPDDPKLFIALAILYDHQGAYEYALPMLDEALALDPNQPLAKEYKTAMRQKIDMRKLVMDHNEAPKTRGPHSR